MLSWAVGCAPETNLVRHELSSDVAHDPDTDGNSDTSGRDEGCEQARETTFLGVGPESLSPYASLIVADIDGAGVPDVLAERWQGVRGVGVLRGEDLADGRTDLAAWFPAALDPAQASFVVGTTGDLDSDGVREVLVGEVDESGDSARLGVWSPGQSDGPIAEIRAWDMEDGSVYVAAATTPDFDGDDFADVPAWFCPDGGEEGRLALFPGNLVAAGGILSLDQAGFDLRTRSGSGRPFAAPDVDADGLDELMVIIDLAGNAYYRIVPPELARSGGSFTVDDLPVLISVQGYSKTPLVMDADGDGAAEVFGMWTDITNFSVLGWSGADVARAATAGDALEPDASYLRIDGERRDYLGATLAPYTDESCESGIAASAHLADRVHFFDGSTVRGGGVVDTSSSMIREGREWYGYVLSGGHDIDGDGADDFLIAGSVGEIEILFSPRTAP